MSDLFEQTYNPDVLSCLANLSNDEVFTPPDLADQVLDMLPEGIWHDPDVTFLDPCCKSGVFLREIAKRLIDGLQDEIPELQERLDHIFKKQIFGIATTELCSLLSRRSLYCSKYPNCKYSVVQFDKADGNVRYKRCEHTWFNGKCVYCGASQGQLDRGDQHESYAYESIHCDNLEELFPMKFDVIVGNPPYQLKVNEAGKGLGAIPLYQKFVEQALKLSPRYLSMIIPSRWFCGGVGLDMFRNEVLNNGHISKLVDYTDSNDCFPGVDVNGGICYFLYDSHYNSNDCVFTNVTNGVHDTRKRCLNEFDILIRQSKALSIIHKVLGKHPRMLSAQGGCSSQTPYGFLSTYMGTANRTNADDCTILGSKGWSYVPRAMVKKSQESIDQYKPMISKLSCEHAGNPDKSGMYRVLSRMEILKPGEICNQSYLIVCPMDDAGCAKNVFDYLRTKFVRFLLLQTLAGMNISINNFRFVPWLDFTSAWNDDQLNEYFCLDDDEIGYINSVIRPMDNGD